MRAAIYARKSTDDPTGVARQVTLAREFAATKGWRVADAHVFTDNDVSGAIFKRKGLDALLAAVAAKAIDVLVMMEASRLGRDMGETLALQSRITKAGVAIWHYQDQQELLLATPVQKLQASISNYGAEDFRYQIKLKTTAAMRAKAKAGHETGGKRYGYASVPVGDHVERQVVPAEAAIVRRMFKLYGEGKGTRAIAKQLMAEHVPGPRATSKKRPSKGWAPATIRDVLSNPCYKGQVVYGGATVQAESLRIVSDGVWQAAQERRSELATIYLRANNGELQSKPVNSVDSKYVLSGLCQCATCGGPMGVVRRNAGKLLSLRCRRFSDKGTAACSNSRMLPLRQVETAILTALEAELAEDVLYGHLYPSLGAPPSADDVATQRAQLTQALTEATRACDKLLEAVEAGGEAIPALLARLKDRGRTKKDLTTQLAALEAQAARPALTVEEFGARVVAAAKGWKALASERPERVRAKLRKLLQGRIVLTPPDARGRVTFSADLTLESLAGELQLPASPAGGSGIPFTPTVPSPSAPGCPTSSSTAPPPWPWRSRKRSGTTRAGPPRRFARSAADSAPWCGCPRGSWCGAATPRPRPTGR